MNQFLLKNRNYVLRKILNHKENIHIIKNLIEGILNLNIKSIELNDYLEEKEKYLPLEENFGVADVRIKTDTDEEFNVGISFLDGMHIQTKIALYYLYVHTNQICYDDKRPIAKTITINFLDFPYYQSFGYHKKAILNKFRTIDFSEEEAETHIIELPKFKVLDANKMTKQEQWISYIKGERKIINKVKRENKYIRDLDNMVHEYWINEKI